MYKKSAYEVNMSASKQMRNLLLFMFFFFYVPFLFSCKSSSMKECSSAQDCETGEACGIEKKCVIEECRKEQDCSNDSICILSTCRKKCTSSSMCSNNTSCFYNLTGGSISFCLDLSKIAEKDKNAFVEVTGSQKECSKTADCPSKEYCDLSRCFAAECSQDGDCTSGNICFTPYAKPPKCRKQCASSKECKTGEACYEVESNKNICFPKAEIQGFSPVDTSCQITILSASITGCWDAPCGSADPIVHVYIEKRRVGSTSSKTDNHEPVWNYDVPGEYSPTQINKSLTIDMIDEDLSSNDEMMSTNGPWEISKGTVSISNQYVTLKVKFTCKEP